MLSIFLKVFGTTLLAVFGFFMYGFPEQSVVLLIGVGLTVFAIVLRRRRKPALK
jgi:hypothetical protein